MGMISLNRPWPSSRCVIVFLAIAGFAMLPGKAEEPGDSSQTKQAGKSPLQDSIAKDISGWIGDYEYVEVVLYNSEPPHGTPLVSSGKLNKGVAKAWTKRLSPEEVALLTTYITGKREPKDGAACYIPHHGFVFYGKDSKILGHLEICFMCERYYSLPRRGLATNWDLAGLKALVTKKGLPHFNHPDEWAAFFANKELVGKGEMEQSAVEEKIAE